MSSLQRRLTLAFAVVALVSIGAVAAITTSAIRTEFDRYLFGPMTPPVVGPAVPSEAPPGLPPDRPQGSTPPGIRQMPHMRDPGMQTLMRRMMGAPEVRFLLALRRATWLSALVGVLAAVLLGALVARRLTAPLRQVSDAAAGIGKGELTQEVPVASDDELGGLARAFNAMAANLKRLEESRRNLSADIAHELRTPLSVLQANIEGMLDGVVELTPDRLAALHTQVGLLSRLVDDLRDLSLAQAGRLPLQRRPVDVAGLIGEAAAAAGPYAGEKRVSVETDVPAPLPSIRADRERLLQVLHNLLDNAIRHTPAEGIVTVGAVREGPALRVWVRDSGPGIPPDEVERIFDRFYRLDASRSRARGGTGLGLAIVRALVEAHDGSVAVSSRQGEGSTFVVMLPLTG